MVYRHSLIGLSLLMIVGTTTVHAQPEVAAVALPGWAPTGTGGVGGTGGGPGGPWGGGGGPGAPDPWPWPDPWPTPGPGDTEDCHPDAGDCIGGYCVTGYGGAIVDWYDYSCEDDETDPSDPTPRPKKKKPQRPIPASASGFMWGSAAVGLSINGIHSGRNDDLLRPGDVAGSAATTANPILAANGFKVEDYTDFVVSLPGRDFELTRHFSGASRFLQQSSFGLFALGGWTLSTDATVFWKLDPVLAPSPSLTNDEWRRMGHAVVVPSPIRDTTMFQNFTKYKPESVWYTGDGQQLPEPPTNAVESIDRRREFRPMGPSMLRLTAGHYTGRHPDATHYLANPGATVKLPVWILTDPGAGTSIFFRNREATLFDTEEINTADMAYAVPGKLWAQIDEFGNVWNYEYSRLAVDQNSTVPRLTAIYLHGNDDRDAKAVVTFTWGVMMDGSSRIGSGLWHVRTAEVWRPYEQGSRQWFLANRVEYYYTGDVYLQCKQTDPVTPAPLWLGLFDDLALVANRTAVAQPMGIEERTIISPWHTRYMQYRTSVQVHNNVVKIQLKGAFAPQQLERLVDARWRIESLDLALVDRGRSILGTSDPVWNVEAGAWGVLACSDAEDIAPPGNPQGALPLWRVSDKWVTYYGMPSVYGSGPEPANGDEVGQVKHEFMNPADGGHTLRLHHVHSTNEANELDSKQVTRIARVWPQGATGATTMAVSYSLKSSVVHITEATRRTDALPSDETWTDRRKTSHRSEDRDLFTMAYEQRPASGGPVVTWFISTVPLTVAERVEDLESGNSRVWSTIYEFDEQLRPRRSFDPGAVAEPLSASRLANWEAILAADIDRTRLGSIQTVKYADGIHGAGDYGEHGPSGAFLDILDGLPFSAYTDPPRLRGKVYDHQYPATLREQKRFSGYAPASDPPAAEVPALQFKADYRDTLTRTGTYILSGGGNDAQMRPDLPTLRWAPVDGVDSSDDNDPNGTKETVSYTYGFRSSPSPALFPAPLDYLKITRERELESENGPAAATAVSTEVWLNSQGNVVARLMPEGLAEGYEYDPGNGHAVAVHSVGSIQSGAFTPDIDTWTSRTTVDVSGNKLATISPDGVVTSYDFGVAPRPDDPIDGYEVHFLHASQFPHDNDGHFAGPAIREWYNAQLRVLRADGYQIVNLWRTAAGAVYQQYQLGSTTLSRAETEYNGSGLPVVTRAWPFTSSGAPFPNTVPDTDPVVTTTVFDGNQSPVEIVDVLGNVHLNTYDSRGRLIASAKSVVGSLQPPVIVQEHYYDGEDSNRAAVGDGLLTVVASYPTGSGGAARFTRSWYDARNRAVLAGPGDHSGPTGEGPYSFTAYDNLDRPVLSARFSSAATIPGDPSAITEQELLTDSSVDSVSKTFYSQRGLPYRSLTLLEGGVTPQWHITNQWYDDLGRPRATTSSGAPTVRRTYDLHGRVLLETQSSELSVPDFTTTLDIEAGCILQRTENTYSIQNRPTLLGIAASTRRGHLESAGQGIGSNNVTTYRGFVYDQANRQIATIDYGTNASTDEFTSSGATAPSAFAVQSIQIGNDILQSLAGLPSDALVSRVAYDERGQASISATPVTGSSWRIDRSYADSMGRTIATVENCSTTNPITLDWNATDGRWSVQWGTSNGDQDRVTTKVYDLAGNVIRHTAHLRDQSTEVTQTTSYRYQWTEDDAIAGPLATVVPSHGLLFEIRYPSTAAGTSGQPSEELYDRVRMGYNAIGEQQAIEDQNGTIRVFLRDGLGRTIADRVHTFGSRTGPLNEQHISTAAVDTAVSQIITAYDPFGRTAAVISCANPNPGTYDPDQNLLPTATLGSLLQHSSVTNFVRYEYDYSGNLRKLRQSPDGPDAGSNPYIRVLEHTYSLVSWHSGASRRLNETIYPDITPFTKVKSLYSNTVEDKINRISKLTLTDNIVANWPVAEYWRLGLSTVAVTDFPSVGVQLDRTVRANGQRHFGQHSSPGIYGGWDRLGRLVRNSWVELAYTTGRQPLWQERYEYDRRSRKLAKENTRTVYDYTDEDWAYGYDGLDRVTQATRGQIVNQSLVSAWGSKEWTLDELGNWKQQQTGGGGSQPSVETRAHNATNEIKQIGSWHRFYDPNGNLRIISTDSSGTDIRQVCIFDAWNRLVRLERPAGSLGTHISTYAYNGLNWRVKERRQPAGASGAGADVTRRTYYSAQWQQLVERITDAASGVPESYERQFWGLRGLDDAILRMPRSVPVASEGGGEEPDPEPSPDESFGGYFQLTDSSFSVIGHLDIVTGRIRQWMSYNAYGEMKILHPGDFDGNNRVTQEDLTRFLADHDDELPSADFNGDGVVDADDYDQFYAAWQAGSASARDVVRIGYAGYVHDALTGLLLARHRWYEPTAGRWITPDPAGYVDGMSLYNFLKGNPLSGTDPFGLRRVDGDDADVEKKPSFWGRVKRFIVGGGSPTLAKQMNAGIRQREELAADLNDGGGDYSRAAVAYSQGERRYQRAMGEQVAPMAYSSVIDTATGGSVSSIVKGSKGVAEGLVNLAEDGVQVSIRGAKAAGSNGDTGAQATRAGAAGGKAGSPQTAISPSSKGSVLSGHGSIDDVSGATPVTRVPEGTAVTVWGRHGESILDTTGNLIETGRLDRINPADVQGARSYLPGAYMPNYSLHPPTGLHIMGSPTTVSQTTPVSQLLGPQMGVVHWAACLETAWRPPLLPP